VSQVEDTTIIITVVAPGADLLRCPSHGTPRQLTLQLDQAELENIDSEADDQNGTQLGSSL